LKNLNKIIAILKPKIKDSISSNNKFNNSNMNNNEGLNRIKIM